MEYRTDIQLKQNSYTCKGKYAYKLTWKEVRLFERTEGVNTSTRECDVI